MPYAQPPPGYGPAGHHPPHHHTHGGHPNSHSHGHSHSYSQPPLHPHANSPSHSSHHGYSHGNPPQPHPGSRHPGGPGLGMPPVHPQVMTTKRSMPPHVSESPAKKQSKWSPEEDALIIELRGGGMKWEDISKRLPGRSAISCRLHYQNYLERRSEWDEERKNKLARLYERFKPEMWQKVAEEMAVPWRAAEAMHWRMGEEEMAKRAGVVPFSLSVNDSSSHRNSLSRGHSQPPPPRSDYTAPLHQHPQHHPYARHHPMPHAHAHSHSMSMGHPGHGPPPPPQQAPPAHHMIQSPHGSHSSAHRSGPVPPPSHMGGPMSHPRSIPTPGPPPPSSMARHDNMPAPLPPPSMPHDPVRDSGPPPGPCGPSGPPSGPSSHSELAPLHTQTHPHGRSSGMLPSVAELTTGVSPYSTPAYSTMGSGPPGPPGSGSQSHANTRNNSPVTKTEASPRAQQPPSMPGYPPTPTPTGVGSARGGETPTGGGGQYEGVGAKRPASPGLLSRDGSRRRYYEGPDDSARRRMM